MSSSFGFGPYWFAPSSPSLANSTMSHIAPIRGINAKIYILI
jgi:hypothetical protein